ncbi:MAG TPA: type II secretion system major pseudopilin GspG [Chthonomonadaceae bacterium]|nr:type II secretion system major pseudopilin GspG [Chthonomonadaceae bacterium]
MLPQITLRRRARSGFTLIELIVVIVILAILAAIVVPRFFGRTEEAKQAKVSSDFQSLKTAIGLYKTDCEDFPQTLDALIHDPGVKGWKGSYLDNMDKVPMDPWDQPYQYVVPGSNGHDYDIISNGPDGKHQFVNGALVGGN